MLFRFTVVQLELQIFCMVDSKSFAIMSVDGMHTLLVLVIYSVNIGM